MKQAHGRILVTGGTGQVGLELAAREWPKGISLDLPARHRLDLTDPAAVDSLLADGSYAAVINCAAWTAVDLAEQEVAAAWLANAQGPANLAAATARRGLPLVHISTDYVFSGNLDRPYQEEDVTGPCSVYGASKLGGEWAVRTGNPLSLVLRTAWVLSRHRSNFAKTMLRLATERDNISVVADQRGCPTAAADIAAALQTIVMRLLNNPDAPTGVFHFVGSGDASWADLARHIFNCSEAMGGPRATVRDIATADYPTPARRPANSRLDTRAITAAFGIEPRPWQDAVAEIVKDLVASQPEALKNA